MKLRPLLVAFTPVLISLISFTAHGAFNPAEVLQAGKAKHNNYTSDSIYWGGDALANPMTLLRVRWARNKGFERIVIDLGGNGSGWEAKMPPYFQVGVSSVHQEISVNIKGITSRKVTEDSLANLFPSGSLLQSAYLAPPLEGDLAALQFTVRRPVDVESFYLENPPRIVVDVRAKN